jgi:hypothetical protein
MSVGDMRGAIEILDQLPSGSLVLRQSNQNWLVAPASHHPITSPMKPTISETTYLEEAGGWFQYDSGTAEINILKRKLKLKDVLHLLPDCDVEVFLYRGHEKYEGED